MKLAFLALAVLAAAAALFVRPPSAPPPAPVAATTAARGPFARRAPAGEPRGIVVYVAGAVVHPGLYTVAPAARAADALARAGGPRPGADLVAVNLAAPLHDGDEVAVLPSGAPSSAHRGRAPRPRSAGPKAGRGGHRSRRPPPPSVPLDLNVADERALATIPGVGAVLAARIVAFREDNGPFASLDELADVAGVSAHLVDEVAAYAVVR